LTGCPGSDMVTIARTQLGRTMAEFGYYDAWCARFVSDVAALAGESAAIPYNASCVNLINAILGAGGTVVNDWQHLKKGDIVHYCTDGQNHVEIISENSSVGYANGYYYIHSIGGNCRPNGAVSQVYEKDCTYMVVRTIVRPNYSGSLAVASFDYAEAHYDEVFVAGWAYDPDYTGATLTAQVYIGGEMGSENAEYAGELSVNSVRHDVSQVFGIDPYHGFEGWVKTTKTGEQQVYIYITNHKNDKVRVLTYSQNVCVGEPAPEVTDVKIPQFKVLTICDVAEYDPKQEDNSTVLDGKPGVLKFTWILSDGSQQDDEETYFSVSLNKYYNEILALRKMIGQYE